MNKKLLSGVKPLHRSLLSWFAREGRDLPWRRTRDPYRIWISEVMLQQTQVDRVVHFYRRFLKKFPTLKKLAGAKWPELLSVWRGLGYYSRAKNLKRAAQAIITQHGGRFPESAGELEQLPGIGPYTARAIMVFAREAHELVLDTNTRRVLSRYFGFTETAAKNAFSRHAGDIVPRGRSWGFHQGLMDLGALVCDAKEPRCGDCPLEKNCDYSLHALEGNSARASRPLLQGKKKRANGAVQVAAAIIHREGKILVTTRPRGHLKGFWEFPGGKRMPGEDWRACLKRELKEELGIEASVRPHSWAVDHAYEDFNVHIRFHRCQILRGLPRPKEGQKLKWVEPGELPGLKLPPANVAVIGSIATARF